MKYKILTHSKHRSAFFSVFLFTNNKYVSYTKWSHEHMLRDVYTIFKLSIRLCSNSFQTSIRCRFSSLIGCVLHFCLVDLLCCVSLQNDFFSHSGSHLVSGMLARSPVKWTYCRCVQWFYTVAGLPRACAVHWWARGINENKRQVRQSWTRCCHWRRVFSARQHIAHIHPCLARYVLSPVGHTDGSAQTDEVRIVKFSA